MSETKALTISEVMTVGEVMAKSGLFNDARQTAQAVVKVLAGQELGFGPFASMTGISIIGGKPAISSNLMAAAVKAHPRYDYRVARLDDKACELVFFADGKEMGRSAFTVEDAAQAEVGRMVAPGASGSMMKRFARNMLFARAMSNGVRWYCPDVFTGAAVYTPGEMGAEELEDGTIVEGVATVVETEETPPGNGEVKQPHWIDDPKVKAALWAYVRGKGLSDKDVYRLLRIEHIHDYQGSKDDFKAALETALQRAAQSKHPELDNATETELQTMLYGKE